MAVSGQVPWPPMGSLAWPLTVVEADFCALATYTLVGEVLAVLELEVSPED